MLVTDSLNGTATKVAADLTTPHESLYQRSLKSRGALSRLVFSPGVVPNDSSSLR